MAVMIKSIAQNKLGPILVMFVTVMGIPDSYAQSMLIGESEGTPGNREQEQLPPATTHEPISQFTEYGIRIRPKPCKEEELNQITKTIADCGAIRDPMQKAMCQSAACGGYFMCIDRTPEREDEAVTNLCLRFT